MLVYLLGCLCLFVRLRNCVSVCLRGWLLDCLCARLVVRLYVLMFGCSFRLLFICVVDCVVGVCLFVCARAGVLCACLSLSI